MVFVSRKIGSHLSANAQRAIAKKRPYPQIDTLHNPLTRGLARTLTHRGWERTLEEIDFGYTMSDNRVADVPCVRYETASTSSDRRIVLYLHGGGFIGGGARVNASAVLPVCHLAGCAGIGVDYTLTPEARFPKALEEIETVYRELIAASHKPLSVFLYGDSAGGNLVLASMLRWRRRGLPLPAGAILMSPSLDGTLSSDTIHTLKQYDPLIRSTGAISIHSVYKLYADGADLDHPEISPLHGDFTGLPPLLVQVGSREMLLGESARLAEYARRDGCDVTLRVFDGMFHLFHMHWSFDEARLAHRASADFIKDLSRPQD